MRGQLNKDCTKTMNNSAKVEIVYDNKMAGVSEIRVNGVFVGIVNHKRDEALINESALLNYRKEIGLCLKDHFSWWDLRKSLKVHKNK